MRIVVSDSSCLIDLRKVSLLDALLRLPCEFLIPNTLFEDELLKFTASQKKALLRGGLQVIDLPGERVLRAQAVMRQVPRLSVHDGFAFALAEHHPGCILLTGDGELRKLATQHKIEVHGILWVIDELHHNGVVKAKILLTALKAFSSDPTVRLPRREVLASIQRFCGLKWASALRKEAMAKAKKKVKKPTTKRGSLLAPTAMGGIVAGKGFDFQTRYAAWIRGASFAKPEGSDLSLKAFVDAWWKPYLQRKGVKPSTKRNYDSILELHILPVFGELRIDEVVPLHVERFIQTKVESGLSGITVRNLLLVLQGIMSLALDNDLIDRSPIRKRHKPTVDKREKPIWSPAQLLNILSAAPTGLRAFFD